MIVTFISECEKKSLNKTRRVLDAFADRIGQRTWQTIITLEGLNAVKTLLRKTATKNTAVSCHQLKSRRQTEFLWVVGNKTKFNNQGIVPVNYTQKNLLTHNETDWNFLPALQSLTVFSALLHDFGKLTTLFQEKLRKGAKTSEPLRHEWVSLLFLVAIVDGRTDNEWINDLISDEIHQKITKLKIKNLNNPLANLPPVASLIGWLILSHHKLPSIKEGNKDKSFDLNRLFELINQKWGYQSKDNETVFKDWFKYTELPSKSLEWQKEIKTHAIKLKDNLLIIETLFYSQSLRPAMLYARLSLILADHFYSSQDKNKDWHSSLTLFANTKNNQLDQQLDEHLVGVAKQSAQNIKKLPYFEGVFNQDIRVKNNKNLNQKSTGAFKWQDKAVSTITKWRKENPKINNHQFGFFVVNIASTGKGKTYANAKIMQALSANQDSLRYILALGLRTLTLQTGDEYKAKIGLKNNELAVLIGSKAIASLHYKESGSESTQSLLGNELIFDQNFPEQGLDTVLKNKKDRQFLYAPVLSCTIDHIIQATEITRGGRHILPTLRLMSSDLVIDEIDDFDNDDLIAIGRLIHLAGMLGRKVMISSATIPPALAEGYFNAYQAGWQIFAQMRNKDTNIGCAWVDEFSTRVKNISNTGDYQKQHHYFIDKRIDYLNQQIIKRKANIFPCNTDPKNYFKAIKEAVLEKHQAHCFEDPKTKKKISLGVVRIANINPCIALTRYLLQNPNQKR